MKANPKYVSFYYQGIDELPEIKIVPEKTAFADCRHAKIIFWPKMVMTLNFLDKWGNGIVGNIISIILKMLRSLIIKD